MLYFCTENFGFRISQLDSVYLFRVFVYLFIWLCCVLVVACKTFCCTMQSLSCSMWDLVPWPGIQPRPPALGVQSLSQWTSREVPGLSLDNPSFVVNILSIIITSQLNTCLLSIRPEQSVDFSLSMSENFLKACLIWCLFALTFTMNRSVLLSWIFFLADSLVRGSFMKA